MAPHTENVRDATTETEAREHNATQLNAKRFTFIDASGDTASCPEQTKRKNFRRNRDDGEDYNEDCSYDQVPNKPSIAGPSPPSFFSMLRMLSFAEFTFTATDLLRYVTLGITVLILLVYLFPTYALISLLLALAFCLMLVCVCINRIRAEVGRKRVQPSKLQQLRNELYSSKRNN